MRRSAPIMDNPPPHIKNDIFTQLQRDLNHFLVSLERSIGTASAANADTVDTQQNSKSTWISSRTHSDKHKHHDT